MGDGDRRRRDRFGSRFAGSRALNTAAEIDRIALSEVRQLKEAQRGNTRAVDALIRPYLQGVWSICRAHVADEQEAIDEVVAFRDALEGELDRFTLDEPFGLQLYALLWRRLCDRMEPSERRSIPQPPPGPTREVASEDPEEVRKVVLQAPPYARLIYLFWLVTGLPAARLAEILGETEPRIRQGRAVLISLLHEALDR